MPILTQTLSQALTQTLAQALANALANAWATILYAQESSGWGGVRGERKT